MAGGTPANRTKLAERGEYSSAVQDLRGRTVLLTGAHTGLGPHIARKLHQAGARFVLSARNEPALQKLAKEAGDVDVLVANAGVPIKELGERQKHKR
jgi:NADP-dependent 3-hydroxy acid dehydrogenase YdfG